MKKRGRLAAFAAVCLLCSPVRTVYAEDEPYSNTEYWNDRCTGKTTMTSEDKAACMAYAEYLGSQNDETQKRLEEANANIEKYEEDIAKYGEEIQALQEKINTKQAELDDIRARIADKQAEIDAKQVEIDAKQEEIDAKQAEIDETEAQIGDVREKMKERLVLSQRTMRVNPYLDILMGAESLETLIRILNGMASINAYDQKTMDELSDLIDLLDQQEADLQTALGALEDAMAALEVAKGELNEQKNTLLAAQESLIGEQYEVQKLEEVAEQQKAELEAAGNKYAADIEAKNAQMAEIAAAGVLDAIPVSATAGWTYPVPGAVRSAGTWYYGGGGVHLGYDFAAPLGTEIHAVGNGIVINSANGCPTYGYLGSGCGYQYGGSSGGGNQVYLLTAVNGELYAVKYLHMMINTPIETGTVVTANDVIGQVGTSGNSSGPHCHIEIFYLGDAKDFSDYATNWNGDLAFGCGWGYAALARTCDNGVGAPCRLRPESIFGE